MLCEVKQPCVHHGRLSEWTDSVVRNTPYRKQDVMKSTTEIMPLANDNNKLKVELFVPTRPATGTKI